MTGADDDQDARTAECSAVERLLSEWHTQFDELKVQGDLAVMNVRDELAKAFSTAENVFLAARSRLDDARADSGSDLKKMRLDVEHLLSDLKGVFETVTSVVQRARS